MKLGSRLISITSGSIINREKTVLIGVISHLDIVEGILSTTIDVNGTDSTDKIIDMLNRSKFKDEVELFVFNGTTLAGLNIIDLDKLNRLSRKDYIIINKDEPSVDELSEALISYDKKKGIDCDDDNRIKLVLNQPEFKFSEKYKLYTLSNLDAIEYDSDKVELDENSIEESNIDAKESNFKNMIPYGEKFLRLSHLISVGVSSLNLK